MASRRRGVGVLSVLDVDERARRVHEALDATCVAMHSPGDVSEEAQAWSDNLGHQIAYVSSPLAMLGRLGVLKKCKVGSRGALALGTQRPLKSARRTCASDKERAVVRATLGGWLRLADAIVEIDAPTTCKGWVDKFESIVGKMAAHQPVGMIPKPATKQSHHDHQR